MANDIDKTSPHYKGDFGSIYEVNKKFPTGGVAGDFVVIEGWAHYWNADRGTWCVNAQRDSYWDELITGIIEKFKLFKGATYMGVAGLDTLPAKAIGAKMYYFATVAGTYNNFGGLVVPQGINVLYSENGSSWVCSTLLEVAQELGLSTWKVVSQKALNDALELKANQSSVNEALAKKANKADMDVELGKKANTADVDTKFTEEKKRVDGELDKKFDKESVGQYTYWGPSVKPVFQVGDTDRMLSFAQLTIVKLNNSQVILNSYSQDITINGLSGVAVVYYDLVDKRIYTAGPGGGLLPNADSKPITDLTSIITLGIVENTKYIDVLALSSRYIGNHYDLSVLGQIKELRPSTTSPIIFTKYKWDIIRTLGPTNNPDIRINDRLHTKHKYIYVKGKLDFSEGTQLPSLSIVLDDANKTGTGIKNLLWVHINSDAQGNFEGTFVIPDTIWDGVDYDKGYNLFVLVDNTVIKGTFTLNVYDAYVADYAGADNPYCLDNEAIEDTIKYSEILSNLVTINEDDHIYGRYNPKSQPYSSFPIAAHVDYSATTTNSEAESDGFLTEVRAQVNGKGIYTFKVGLLDQYPRFVVSNEFTLYLSGGLNIIDVSDKRIPIAKGEQLAISCTSNAGTSGTSSISYRENTEPIDNELFYGFNNGIWAKLATEYGGEINLSYKMLSLDSIFALKSNVDSLEEQIEKQNDAINSLRYVYDNNGVPYKLSIYNGKIVVKSVQYKKVLALGNSLTSHSYAENIGYYGDSTWAMASTNKVTTTWTNHLQTILRQKQLDATVTPFNIAAWETNYMGVDLDTLFTSHKGIEYDLIVIRAGENGTAGDDYAQGVDKLVTFLRTNFPLADIIITDMFWHNSVKEAGFKEIAEKYNYQYISFGNIADRCLLGQMLMGRDDQFHPITHNGVAGHCTDVCFFDFANILAKALGYSQISGKYTVTINTSIDYSINQTSQVADGYVSILTYGSSAPTVNVKQGESVVQTTSHSLRGVSWINTPSKVPTFVTTFKMPNDDVVVTIR